MGKRMLRMTRWPVQGRTTKYRNWGFELITTCGKRLISAANKLGLATGRSLSSKRPEQSRSRALSWRELCNRHAVANHGLTLRGVMWLVTDPEEHLFITHWLLCGLKSWQQWSYVLCAITVQRPRTAMCPQFLGDWYYLNRAWSMKFFPIGIPSREDFL